MLRFFTLILSSIFLAVIFYTITAIVVSGSLTPQIFAYTYSTSLNHSLHRFERGADGYVVGSSIALRNVDAEILSSGLDQEFQVLAGLGMKPLETLKLLTEINLKNKTIIIPLCIAEINKLSVSPRLEWNSLRFKNFTDFLKDREINEIPVSQIGHVQFNSFGNAFFPSCERGMNMPFEKHGAALEAFEIDSSDYMNYFEELKKVQKRQKLELHLVLTPYSTNYGHIDGSCEIPMMKQMFSACDNDSLILHDFSYDELEFEKFIDFVHMSDIGAREFTRNFARHFANHRRANEAHKKQLY